MHPKVSSANLLTKHSRELASDLDHFETLNAVADGGRPWASKQAMVAHKGACIYEEVEFTVRVGFLTMDEALGAVRRGLGHTLNTYRDALIWATDDFQKRMSTVMANSFARNPRHPFNQRILSHDDPRDRIRSWCEAQGRMFLIAYGTYDRLKERHPDRHSGTKEDNLRRRIASVRIQIEFAAELGLIAIDEAVDSIRQGMNEALEKAKADFPSVTDESEKRIQKMIEVGIRQAS